MEALAEKPDGLIRNGVGGSCRLSTGDSYLDDHEPVGSIRRVVGKTGIYQKIILADLDKAVKEVGSVIPGGHLSL